MNYQASNPESLSKTPERLSETKTISGSPVAAAKKRAAEVLTCSETVQFARAFPGSEVIPRAGRPFYPLPITTRTSF